MDETHVREAIELARAAAANGNTPFGSLLVVDGTVVRRSENTTLTDDDVTAHPELKLARWAARELDADELADCTMYTSTEPCEMCAAAIHYAGIDRVVFSVSGESLATLQERAHSGVPCAEIVERKGGSTDVDGPVLEAEGLAVHEEYY
jgi:tRNA(Arg) A34 adenosine deaminase TadA